MSDLAIKSSRAESIDAMRSAHQRVEGGAIPASALFWHHGEVDEACRMVECHHYSHRSPSNIQHVTTAHVCGGLFANKGEAVAAVIFTFPPTRWSSPVWELSRLVRLPTVRVPLTAMISAAVARIRRRGEINLLVSFADRTQKHEGYVYRAAGWKWSGVREPRMDGIFVDGQFISGRTANHVYGTQSPSRLAEIGVTATAHFDEGKHIYWKALSADGNRQAASLGLEILNWKN